MGGVFLVFFKGLAWGYYFLPRGLQLAFGWMLGRLLECTKLRSRVVNRNLDIAFPSNDARGVERTKGIFSSAYTHLGHLFFEVLLVFGPLKRFVDKWVDVEGAEHFADAKKRGKGMILLSSHVGNWEIMSAASARYDLGLMIVTKHLKPEWLHRAIESGRKRAGYEGTYEPRTMRDVLRTLKKNRAVGFVLDQYAGPPIGVRVPFFGVWVGTANVAAIVARRTEAPVIPVLNYRGADGRIKIKVRPPLSWKTHSNKNRELAINTAYYVSVMEADVKAHAEQWLWIHNRFKGNLSNLEEKEWDRARTRQ